MGNAARSLATLALGAAAIVLFLGGPAGAAAPDNALQFDGTNDYVTFGVATSTLGATQFTLETWFKRAGTSGDTMGTGGGGLTGALPLVTKGCGEGESPLNLNMNYFLGLDAATNKLVADFEDTVNGGNHPALPATGTLVATPDVWHHAAATYDGTTWRLYLDGKLDRAVVVGNFTPESTSIQHAAIGSALTSSGIPGNCSTNQPGFFAGQMDEVRIWNVVRTGAQIRANKDSETPTPTTGLRGNWHLDEGSGTTAGDSSGQNVTGTLTDGPLWVGGYTFPPDASAPASVQNLTATPGNTTVNLSWSANLESDLAGYNVYRALSSPVPTGGTPLNGGDLLQTTSFNDTGLTNGTPYFYALVAVDGSNNPSTPVEATATPSGGAPPANALQFNGSSQYVRFGTVTPNPGGTPDALNAAQFTLEIWFNRTGAGVTTTTSGAGGNGLTTGAVPLIAKGRGEGDYTNVDMNYFLGINSTNVLAADFEDSVAVSPNPNNHAILGTTPITNSVWHHAAATYDGTTFKLYLDGELEVKATVSVPPRSDSVQRTALGSALTSAGVAAGFFQGLLDEGRIWNVARTGAEIRANRDDEITSASGLRGRWGMNQTSGDLADSAGSNTGTLTGGPTYVAGYTFPQDLSAPASVQNLTATPGNTTVNLSWSANGESDLAGYNVYRALSSPVPTGGTPLNGDDLLQTTNFNDTGLTNGTPYFYALVAVDGSNNPSTSVEANATPSGGPGDLVLVGAGDIAGTWTQDTATAALVSGIPGNVFTIGDNAYQDGTAQEFSDYYDPTWGAFKARTRPTAGNHDFGNGATPGATPYFDYFNGVGDVNGLVAGDRALGYYSYDIGTGPNTWHVVVLNSECEPSTGYWLPGGCAEDSAQDDWLETDLANATTNNIIAMWHKPRWASAGNHAHMQALWQDLYDGGADILLGGHWHNYERLAPMDASGASDPTFGVRQFVIGTGGAGLSGFGTILPTSEIRNNVTHGVMKFTLHASTYDWQFIPIAGQTFTDSGTSSTHEAPGALDTPPVADYDGDGDSDFAIYRPGERTWYIRGVPPFVQWGEAGDIPVPGDYDGNGTTEIAVYSPDNGMWYVRGQTPAQWQQWGAPGSADIPVPADYDGNGSTDVAVYRPSTATFWVKNQFTLTLGQVGDIPVPGNYDADPAVEPAVYRPSTRVWVIQGQADVQWGNAGDVPVPGDYNGDGQTDITTYSPADGYWWPKDQPPYVKWGGIANDVPVPGNYNGDASDIDERTIYRRAAGSENGFWYVHGASSLWAQWGGQANDVVVNVPPALWLQYYD